MLYKKRKKTLSNPNRNFKNYRYRYHLQFFVSCFLFLAVLSLTFNWPAIWAEVQTGSVTITTDTQWGLGSSSDISVGSDAISIDGDGGPDWYSDYHYRMKATFDAAALTAAVDNLPIMVYIDDSAEFTNFWSNIQDTTHGYDVVFTDTDGTLLDFHLEKFDYAGQELIAWVEVPEIENNSTDYIYLYYSKAAASNLQDEAGTYDSDGGYALVQHLSESPANGVEGHFDSTSNNIDGTARNFNSTVSSNTNAVGVIDGADIFDGTNDYVDLGSSNDLTGDNLQKMTISIWVKYVYGTQSKYALSIKRSSDPSSLITIVANSKTSNDNTAGYLGFLTRNFANDNHKWLTYKNEVGYNDGSWHQVVAIIDDLNRTLYIDGVQRGSDSEGMQSVSNNTSLAIIGSYNGISYSFPGSIDEVKILKAARSVDWVTANYLSETDSLIGSWGSEESILQSPGEYISHTLDLEKIYAWGDCTGASCNGSSATFTTNLTIPANTSVKYELSHSADAVTWSSWVVLNTYSTSGTKILTRDQVVTLLGDITNRYVRIRATLTSTDGISNPSVLDYQIDYSKDIDVPTNPDTLGAYSEDGGDTLASGNWYNHANPYFEWSGSTDADSGMTGGYAGYWICFGSTACEPTDGIFVTEAAYTASSLSSNQTYYFRIKAQDAAGNIASSAYAAFVYKYDGTAPNNPSGILPNPAGFSNVNNFEFTWNAGTDVSGSGVAEYCYKTAEASSADTCIPGTTISGIEAYQEGANIFYVRSKDATGNEQDFYTSVYYYFSANAPSEPQGLAVAPTSNTENSFAFSWYAPATYSNPIAGYYYSVNVLPNEGNATFTSNQSVAAGPFATQQGSNVFYVVAQDDASNIEWDAFSSIEFEAQTTAPGIPGSVLITDSSIRDQASYLLTITWSEPTSVGSGIDHYIIDKSTDDDCENGTGTFVSYATTESLGYLDSGLDNQTRYCYRVKASDNAGAISVASSIVSFIPEGRYTAPPEIIINPQVESRIQSAVVEWQTDREASSFVEYGLTDQLGEETGLDNFVIEHEVTILGLEPETTYYYRVKYTDQDNNTGYSALDTFITADAPSAPIGLLVTPESNTENSFAFSWQSPVDEGVTIAGYYYSINSAPTENNLTFVAEPNLAVGPYATRQGINTFYVIAVDEAGHLNYDNYAEVDFSAETTAPNIITGLVITDSSNREQKIYSNTLIWQKAVETGVAYEIERSTDLADNFINISSTESFGYLDIGLDNTLTYYYRIRAVDSAGAASAYSSVVSQKPEGKYRTPPEITVNSQVVADSYSADLTWRTERPASSHVEFGTSEDLDEEQGTAELVEGHEITITGLLPETIYYYRVKSQDQDVNIAYSAVSTFITVEAPQVSNVTVTNVGMFEAQVTWETNKDTTTLLEYGTTKSYGATLQDTTGSLAKTHTLQLTGLLDGTTYHLMPKGVDQKGNLVSSSDYTLTTRPMPKIENIDISNVSEGQSRVTWTTNVPTTSYVEYYTEDISPKTQGQSELATSHDVLLFGLTAKTEYSYKIHSVDQYGYEVIGLEKTFTTQEDLTSPEIFDISAESNVIGSGEEARVQILISWKTNEPTTSQILLAQGISSTEFIAVDQASAELLFEHLEVVQDLTQASNYSFKVVAEDKAGNTITSESFTVLTSKKRQSVLDIIVTNISKRFSWLIS